MKNSFKKLVFVGLLFLPLSVLAKEDMSHEGHVDDYYANYYEDEGALLFKIRGFYASTNARADNLPTPINAGANKPGRVVQNGYGFDTAMTIFATDHIAAEVALGFGVYRGKSSALSAAIAAYGTATAKAAGKRKEIFMIPLTITTQYHIAPFGGFRPYIGGGLNGTWMHTRSKDIKVRSTFGPVIQAGIDFVAMDDTLFTIDIKKYFLKSKFSFRKELLTSVENDNTQNVSSRVKWDPLVISAGIGFKF